jgi:hypothetical protein
MPGETDAAGLIARVKADISQYEREMKRADQIMGQTANAMQGKAATAAHKTSSAMSLLGKAVAGVFTVAAIREAAQFAEKLAQINERAIQVRGNFARLLEGGDIGAGLRELQDATGRGADNLFLMEASSRLMAVHLAESNAEAAELLRLSSQLGKFSKGLTVEQSVNALLPLLSNQSALRLDEFGLSGDRVKALAEKYEAAGMESGAAFKRAFVEEAQATLDRLGEQVVTETERAAAARENITTGLAQSANQGLLGKAYQWVRGAATDVLQFGGDYLQNVADRRAQIDEYVAGLERLNKAGVLSDEATRAMTTSLVGLNAEIEFSNMSQSEMEQRIKAIEGQMPAVTNAWAAWEQQIQGVDAATSAVQARLEQMEGRKYRAELEIEIRVNEQAALAAIQRTVGYQPWMDEFSSEMQAGMWAGGPKLVADSSDEATMDRVLAWQAARNTQPGGRRPASGGGGGGGGGLSAYEQMMREQEAALRSAASAVFTTSSTTDRDWWETSTGQYRDKPDEYLRRLRSAMTDPGSQWKDLLGGRSGDEARLYAAQQEELWRSGQWSQMGPGFDAEGSRTAMVDQIIQRVNADRSRQSMIESLIRDPRLQALGMSASELTAATGTPMAAAGVEQMNVMVKAAGSVDAGRQIAESIDAQFRSTEDLWVAMGESAMGWFTTGFANLAPEIATALARTLLGPLLDEMERTGVRARP